MNRAADGFDVRASNPNDRSVCDRTRTEDEIWTAGHRFAFERFEDGGGNALKLRAEQQHSGEAIESAEAIGGPNLAVVGR